MRLTYDDLNLITCSNDGTMCLWKLFNTERKCVKMDPDFSYSKEVSSINYCFMQTTFSGVSLEVFGISGIFPDGMDFTKSVLIGFFGIGTSLWIEPVTSQTKIPERVVHYTTEKPL